MIEKHPHCCCRPHSLRRPFSLQKENHKFEKSDSQKRRTTQMELFREPLKSEQTKPPGIETFPTSKRPGLSHLEYKAFNLSAKCGGKLGKASSRIRPKNPYPSPLPLRQGQMHALNSTRTPTGHRIHSRTSTACGCNNKAKQKKRKGFGQASAP